MADRQVSTVEGPQVPLFRPRDAYLLAYVPVMATIAWLVPEHSWEWVCRSGARLTAGIRRRHRAELRAHIVPILGIDPLASNAETLVAARAANYHLATLQLLRCYRIGGWRPRIQLEGREHIEQALAAAKGGILWVLPSAFGSLVTKMALDEAGFHVSHLSRPEHGFSPSRFGVRVLNPIVTAVERRYVAERLVMAPGQSVRALKELVRRVVANGLISITVGNQGRRTHRVPFFSGMVRLADGAPALAQSTGAALLPVSTARTGPGTFVTTVHSALHAPQTTDHDGRVRDLLRQCAGLMEAFVRKWPEQYARWDF